MQSIIKDIQDYIMNVVGNRNVSIEIKNCKIQIQYWRGKHDVLVFDSLNEFEEYISAKKYIKYQKWFNIDFRDNWFTSKVKAQTIEDAFEKSVYKWELLNDGFRLAGSELESCGLCNVFLDYSKKGFCEKCLIGDGCRIPEWKEWCENKNPQPMLDLLLKLQKEYQEPQQKFIKHKKWFDIDFKKKEFSNKGSAQTIEEAFEKSICKWELYDAGMISHDQCTSTCGLCNLYSTGHCEKCPIFENTGIAGCNITEYKYYTQLKNPKPMLNYLRNLYVQYKNK
jgi:hypothetical protein